ncbi:MAG: NAD-glutamate dehydrogenase, partial [Saprospiraceae bacterium]|nr:NAD-glutamate dehydrogenase [Saprospiraceae bacterium]
PAPAATIVSETSAELQTVFRVYGDVGDLLGLKAVIDSTNHHSSDDKWESLAIRSLRQEFTEFRHQLTKAIVHNADLSRPAGDLTKVFLEQNPVIVFLSQFFSQGIHFHPHLNIICDGDLALLYDGFGTFVPKETDELVESNVVDAAIRRFKISHRSQGQ